MAIKSVMTSELLTELKIQVCSTKEDVVVNLRVD